MEAPVFSDDVPNPFSTGHKAAQAAGVAPVASTPTGRWMAKVKAAQSAPQPATPDVGANDEPVFSDETPPPGRAAMSSPGFGEQALAAKRAATADVASKKAALEATVGSPVDISTGLQNPSLRFNLSTMNNSTDRAKYLSDNGYPAQAYDMGGQQIVVFQDKDGSMKTIRGNGPIGAGDVAGAGPDIVRGGIQAALIPLTDGAPLLMRMVAQGAGGGLEKYVENAINSMRGYNSQSGASDAADSVRAGATSALGELIGSALQTSKNAVVGRNSGIFNPSDEGRAVLAAQDRLKAYDPNVKGVTPAAVIGGVVGARERQLAAMANPLQNTYGQIKEGIAGVIQKAIQELTGGAAPAIGDQAATVNNVLYPGLNDVVASMQKEAAAPLAAVPQVSPTVGGRAVQKGAQELPGKLSSRVAQKFENAFKAGQNAPEAENGVVPFDLSRLNATGDEIARGKIGQGIPKEVTTVTETTPAEGFGGPVLRESTAVEPTQVKVGGATPEVQAVIDKIRALNPQQGLGPVAPGTDSPYEVLKLLNTKIGAASEYPGPAASAEAKATSGQARMLQKSMNETLTNPGKGAPADFVPKMQAASNATKFQSKILDTPQMQEALHTMSPEDLMGNFDPANPSFVKTLKRTIDPAKFAQAQDAYFTSLTKEPEKLKAFMDAQRVDPTVANIMLAPERKQLLNDYAAALAKINDSPIGAMLAERSFTARPAIALNSNDAAAVADIIDRAGGPDSPIGKNMRAAIFQRALEGATHEGKIDFKRAAASIESILKTKDGRSMAQSILTPDELQRLTDVQTVTSAMAKHTGSGDVGTSLKTAGVAGHFGLIQTVAHPVKAMQALGDILESWAQSNLWKSETARSALVGVGPRAQPPARIIGGAAARYMGSEPDNEPVLEGGN